ncbi:MAG: tetratricopeptide repeat protein [Chthoniobacterales bacterium]|jgi:tetratricopeptide (TPR) repeat protein
MKSSPLPPYAAALLLGFAVAVTQSAPAQDVVVRKSGQKLEGRIVGTKGNSIKIELKDGPRGAATSVPFADLKELQMQPPAEFEAAAAQLSRGDATGAAAALQKINENFAGLDAPWFQRAAVMLGDAKLAAGDKEGAKAAYDQFAKANPSAIGLANLGMARLALESGDPAGAETLLSALLEQSSKTALPEPADRASLGQACYLMGRVKEAGGDKAGALESYLKASALFPFDKNAVADAQKRAEALRNENPGLIVP